MGHSAGAYYAQAVAEVRAGQAAGLAMLCPLLAGMRDVPAHEVVHSADLGAAGSAPQLAPFRDYFVVHTPEMLERYVAEIEPALPLADPAALERIGSRWTLSERPGYGQPYARPTLVVTGRQDSTVGYAGQWDLLDRYPRATFAVLDRAGHALPHEQAGLLTALVREWLDRVREQL